MSWMRARRAEQDPLQGTLGTLERDVMEIVWTGGGHTVRDVHAALAERVAYTTVMTTLDRLFKKGFVTRTRSGRAFVYSAAQTREQIETALAGGLLSRLMTNRPDAALPLLSHLVDTVGIDHAGLDLLDTLATMVRHRRRQLTREREEEA